MNPTNAVTRIRGLHHAAYRCANSEATRAFYEDFLGLPLVEAFPINTTATGRDVDVLHIFFQMANGGCIAFFEEPAAPFEFKDQRDFDLHIALEVDMQTLHEMFEKGKAAGIDTRGVSDHGFIHSIYFRDPNGYVVELAAPVEDVEGDGFDRDGARRRLAQWQARRQDTGQ